MGRVTGMDILKRHPFAIKARFERVVAVSFAFPEEVVAELLPRGLELDSYEGWGFVTVAMVWTRGLRPAGFPGILGRNFFLAGYRVFARLDDGERRLRGLKILRSETDKRSMVLLGNLMTGYNYRRVDLEVVETGEKTRVKCVLPGGGVSLDMSFISGLETGLPLPPGSPFPDWRTARMFAGPMPFTFSPGPQGAFTVVEGTRASWKPVPVELKEWKVGLFDEAPFSGITPVLANAFMVEDVDYRWEKGRVVKAGGGK